MQFGVDGARGGQDFCATLGFLCHEMCHADEQAQHLAPMCRRGRRLALLGGQHGHVFLLSQLAGGRAALLNLTPHCQPGMRQLLIPPHLEGPAR